MNSVNVPLLSGEPDWGKIEEYKLANHLWAKEYPAFYNTYVRLCVVSGEGLYVRMCSDEPLPKAVYTKRDEPVYNDSCMEIFLQPYPDDERYINIEVNPLGAYLSEIGTGRHDRRFLKEKTDIQCEVVPIEVTEGWGIQLIVPDYLVAECFAEDFTFSSLRQMKLNVYKCGEKSENPHYASLFKIETPTPDYHRPEFFGTAYIIDERN